MSKVYETVTEPVEESADMNRAKRRSDFAGSSANVREYAASRGDHFVLCLQDAGTVSIWLSETVVVVVVVY